MVMRIVVVAVFLHCTVLLCNITVLPLCRFAAYVHVAMHLFSRRTNYRVGSSTLRFQYCVIKVPLFHKMGIVARP